ncbi:hypothetical protein KC19_12G022800 [Ceratodon purpureus]|nr:hypothetical protein KC19_12G022800 [Ceratodon purpureus]
MLVVVVVGSMIFKVITPPPVKELNSPDGPKVTAPRIAMRDGRYLAYREVGVDREAARHYVVHIHGYGGSRLLSLPIPTEVINELGLYVVSFDRAGYGQSDPNPKRSIKSDVEDVEDLADRLGLRPKFYVITTSIGGYTGWGLLKYKPERLAGMALSSPVVNYWWPGLPKSELTKAWNTQRTGDKISLTITHYLPSLTFWYNNQKQFPTATVSSRDGITAFNGKDQEIMKMLPKIVSPEHYKEVTQQGEFESKCRDLMVMFTDWPFTPMSLENPFEIPVHVWQGTEDYLVPANLQKEVASSLPWVTYHELRGYGHFLNAYPGYPEKLVRTLLEDSNKKFML